MDAWKFIADDQSWRPYLNANREVPGRIPESALVSYEWWKRCEIPRQRLLSPVQFWFVGRSKIHHRGRREPCKVLMEQIAYKLDLLEEVALPRSHDMGLWKAPCEAESVLALQQPGIRGLIE